MNAKQIKDQLDTLQDISQKVTSIQNIPEMNTNIMKVIEQQSEIKEQLNEIKSVLKDSFDQIIILLGSRDIPRLPRNYKKK